MTVIAGLGTVAREPGIVVHRAIVPEDMRLALFKIFFANSSRSAHQSRSKMKTPMTMRGLGSCRQNKVPLTTTR
jgi:hypothetical protein